MWVTVRRDGRLCLRSSTTSSCRNLSGALPAEPALRSGKWKLDESFPAMASATVPSRLLRPHCKTRGLKASAFTWHIGKVCGESRDARVRRSTSCPRALDARCPPTPRRTCATPTATAVPDVWKLSSLGYRWGRPPRRIPSTSHVERSQRQSPLPAPRRPRVSVVDIATADWILDLKPEGRLIF